MSKFRTVILTFALVLSFTLAVAAQAPSRIYRIGILTPIESSRAEPATLPALVKALSELGFTEGQNLVIEQRGREGNVEELTHLARELIQTRPDVLVGVTSVPTKALLNTGTKTPIVFMFVSDPVGQG